MLILVLATLSLLHLVDLGYCIEEYTVSGYVFLEGTPVENASITIGIQNTLSDEDGFYEITGLITESLSVHASWDDPETPFIDIFPFRESNSGLNEFNISLVPVAVVEIRGKIEFISKQIDTRDYRYTVYDAETNTVININDYTLEYGSRTNSLSDKLGLELNNIIVPSGRPFYIKVEAIQPSYLSYWQRVSYKAFPPFDIRGEGDYLILERGEQFKYNLLEYPRQKDLEIVEELYRVATLELEKIEDSGFYTLSERFELNRVDEFLLAYNRSLNIGEFDDAFYSLKQAFNGLNNLHFTVTNLWGEAYASTYLLIFIVALTSIVTAELFTYTKTRRKIFYLVLYGVTSTYLYIMYPGSKMIPIESFIYAMIGSMITVFALISIIPGFMKKITVASKLNLHGTVLSIFSLGKQNLKKRKLRSALLLTTLMIFTMSFVALTSLSTSYGLVTDYSVFQKQSVKGIMIEMPPFSEVEYMDLQETLGSELRKPEGWFMPINDDVLNWVRKQENVVNIALKAENQPHYRPKISFSDSSIPPKHEYQIFGILGLHLSNDPFVSEVNEAVTLGSPLVEDDTCLVHEKILNFNLISLGETIIIGGIQLRVVGAFSSDIYDIIDMDGSSILPMKQHFIAGEPGKTPVTQLATCRPEEVIITTLGSALNIPEVEISRLDIQFDDEVDITSTGTIMAITRENRFWINDGEKTFLSYMGTKVKGKGLPLALPWGIVVLNVVATMMSSMHERKKEIGILSSIGLNPAHISGIFMTEVVILGILSGGYGYLIGLGLYPLMNLFSDAPIVTQKISAVWSIATISISLVSVILGSILALRNSAIITPSQKLKWRAGTKSELGLGIWNIDMPVLVEDKNLVKFIEHIDDNLNIYKNKSEAPKIGYLNKIVEDEGFTHKFSHIEGGSRLSDSWSLNSLQTRKNGKNNYKVILIAKGNESTATKAGLFIRKIIIEWNAEIGKTL